MDIGEKLLCHSLLQYEVFSGRSKKKNITQNKCLPTWMSLSSFYWGTQSSLIKTVISSQAKTILIGYNKIVMFHNNDNLIRPLKERNVLNCSLWPIKDDISNWTRRGGKQTIFNLSSPTSGDVKEAELFFK